MKKISIFKKLEVELIKADVIGGGTRWQRELVANNIVKPTLKIYIYKENNHPRPHIHVYYGKTEAVSIGIDKIEVLSGGMKNKYLKKVFVWVEENQEKLCHDWKDIQLGNKPQFSWKSN
jgi:hypothetical protein